MSKNLRDIGNRLLQNDCGTPSAECLRQTLDRFDALLRAKRSPESAWQALFADCPYILSASLPLRLSPGDMVPLGRPGISEPDLIFYPRKRPRLHDSYGIIELKTPQAKVLRFPRKNVIALSGNAATAVAQGKAYLRSSPYSETLSRSDEALFVGNRSYAFVIMGLIRELEEALASDILRAQFSSLLPPNFQIFSYDYLYTLFAATVPPRIIGLVPAFGGSRGSTEKGELERRNETLLKALATLAPREELILRMRFGIGQKAD